MWRWVLVVCSFLAMASLIACASAPSSGESAAPDLSGPWRFEMDIGRATKTVGEMQLTGRGQTYVGTLTTNRGNNVLPIRSLVIADRTMTMKVESPNGEVVFRGTLDADGRSFRGKVTYYDGQEFLMAGQR